VVLAESIDRLSRDQEDIAHIYKRIRHSDMQLVTIAEGEISELHIGLKGTMGALFLKDLAQKTHRGLEGRALAGKSAGGRCYGYDIVRKFDERGEAIRGDRTINAQEAAVIIRIFEDYIAGKSAKRIASDLNREGIKGPTGGDWGHSTINGNRRRGIGILNNELYIGRLIWNRQRFVKHPDTGKREARLNPESEWVITEVPELRLLPQELWEQAKAFQGKLDDREQFWQKQRPRGLLSGLCKCGHCGGGFSKVSATHLGCSTARNKGTCNNRVTIHADRLQERVIGALRARLMEPELCKAFCDEYAAHSNRMRMEHNASLSGYRAEYDRNKRDIDHMIDRMLRDGVDPKLLKDRINALGSRQEQLETLIANTQEVSVLLHPNMGARYADEVRDLIASFNEPEHRQEAANLLRALIEHIELTPDENDDDLNVDLYGDLAGILQIADGRKAGTAQKETAPRGGGFLSFNAIHTPKGKMVAGAGFEPATFRL